jgi:hypothetical protein
MFRMPTPRGTSIECTVAFGLDSLLAVAKSRLTDAEKGLLSPKTAGTIVTFVGAGAMARFGVSVLMSQLFDMALANMVENFGDQSMKAAAEALHEAVKEPTLVGARRHRHTAEGMLRDAYQGFVGSIQQRRAKSGNRLLGYGNEQIRGAHGKAAIAAATIAAILDAENLTSTADWVARARDHFGKYEQMVVDDFKGRADGIAAAQVEFAESRMTAGKEIADGLTFLFASLFAGRPVLSAQTRQQRANQAESGLKAAHEAVEKLESLRASRRSFDAFLKRLSYQPSPR